MLLVEVAPAEAVCAAELVAPLDDALPHALRPVPPVVEESFPPCIAEGAIGCTEPELERESSPA